MAAPPKKKTAFFCTECGSKHLRWQGQCRDCGSWNSLHEEIVVAAGPKKRPFAERPEPRIIPEISSQWRERFVSGIKEFDRILGGGAVPGSTILIGGEPGIGKSSLMLQVAEKFGTQKGGTLFVSGEESALQIKNRAKRFNITGQSISVINLTDLEEILDLCRGDNRFIMIDSIQTIASSMLDSPAGTVSQVREASARLIEMARKENKVLFLVGHITKDGMVAGPKVLEHMVDTVLYFEGDRHHLYRILRAQKNRFGPTGEIGLFEMTGGGLVEVSDPSRLFLESSGAVRSPGKVVSAAVEGSRVFLVEVEALVTTSPYGTPQRVASGIDSRRLAIINAVLEKWGGIPLGGHDIFVNIAGGVRLDDTALDLAFLMAAATSKLNRPLDNDMIIVGEIGLSGDVRSVSRIERRLAEAARLGLKKAVIPAVNFSNLANPEKIEIIPVANVADALQLIA